MTVSCKRAVLGAVGALAVAAPLALPTPALAWWRGGGWHPGWHPGWHGGCCWRGGVGVVIGVPPPVYYAPPPPVYYAPPVYAAPVPRVWIAPHWNGPYWVPGHWS